MDFVCIVLFLAIYHLKPQEWSEVFSRIRFIPMVMFASVASLFMGERRLTWRDFFRTPHDWAMYAFFAWIVLSSPTPTDTFKEFLNRLVFYVVAVQTLTSWLRLRKFLGWWTAMLVITAFLALAGEYFWDPLGSRDITHNRMKGRLVLALSMVNNPNALAHTLAPAISMLYYFCIWKRPLVMKEIGLAALVLPLWAIFLTDSKGGFIVAGAVISATLTFGRPKFVQIAILVILMCGGVTVLEVLPRMQELNRTKTDEAIQGRIHSFRDALTYYQTNWRGVGEGQFIEHQFRDFKYYKASHSTYVQTGAELGRPGMFLFILILWCSLRTLLFAKTQTVEQERVRRILFVLVISYAASGWLVDFAYRASFFLFVAAIGAFHRHLYGLTNSPEPDLEPSWRQPLQLAPAGASPELVLAAGPAFVPVLTVRSLPKPTPFPWQKREPQTVADLDVPAEFSGETPPATFWNRIGWVDVAIAIAGTKAVEILWVYAINHV